MRALAFTVSFLMAFLLFAVQPMATKMVLPTLGGTPAVWNTVMFTFQLLLLLGYLYAHFLTHAFTTRGQFVIHGILVLVTLLFLPLSVALETSDAMIANPIPYLVMAFLTQLGLPFFCLAATAPLLQSWVSRSPDTLSKTPYVLYSASNFGSFAGLLGYVGIVEPLLDLGQQSADWSGLYILGTALLLFTGLRLQPADHAPQPQTTSGNLTWNERFLWIGLAFLPSSLSLGVTTYITTDIASIPLLWVIPLSIYLLSFVDAFRTRPVLVPTCQRIAPIMGLAALMLYGFGGHGFAFAFIFQLLVFGVIAFALHGWLAARQPAARYLTQFYVCLSVGGALGGVLNGLVAPMVFHETLEFPIVLIAASIISFILLQRRDDTSVSVKRHLTMLGQVFLLIAIGGAILYLVLGGDRELLNSQHIMRATGIMALVTLVLYRTYTRAVYACAVMTMALVFAISNGVVGNTTLFKDRNFFGMLRVYENPKTNARYIVHDTTVHGLQSLDPKLELTPLAYYGPLKEIIRSTPAARNHAMAIVGLGAGTLKCLAARNQVIDLYEINPMAVKIAENPEFFTYMQHCPGKSEVLLGDGRIRISEQPDKKYGAIVMDAFSSDAIPNHLLTSDALAVYLNKIAAGGVVVFNTTNRHIDLWPLLAAQAKALGVTAYGKFFEEPEGQLLRLSSFWVVIAKNPQDLAALKGKGWEPLVDEGNRPWTDEYINLLPYFKFLR